MLSVTRSTSRLKQQSKQSFEGPSTTASHPDHLVASQQLPTHCATAMETKDTMQRIVSTQALSASYAKKTSHPGQGEVEKRRREMKMQTMKHRSSMAIMHQVSTSQVVVLITTC